LKTKGVKVPKFLNKAVKSELEEAPLKSSVRTTRVVIFTICVEERKPEGVMT